ncbi:MAG: molybdenum ABC transporter ATP-binding protein [Halieaceae bacterium]
MSAIDLKLQCYGSDGFCLDVDCQLPAGSTTAIYGASGSGKTTLLECLAGLRAAEPGSTIQFGGQSWLSDNDLVPTWQRRVGFVFQDARLFPHLDVRGNLRFASQRAQNDALPLDTVCQWLSLHDLLERPCDQLSAGQKQRVAIGRALLSGPDLLLLDEPLANLDGAARNKCLQGLRSAREALQLPMLYVSHDIHEVSQLADHILVLDQGKVREQGPLLELTSRLDNSLAHQEHAAAIASATIARHDDHYGLTELQLEQQSLWVNQLAGEIGDKRRIRIPARDVSVCREKPEATSILNILQVKLTEMEETSDARMLLRLTLDQQSMLARITRKSATELKLQPGDILYAQIKSAALLSDAGDQP